MKTLSQRPARSVRSQLAASSILVIACLATTLMQAQGVAPVNQNVNQIAILHWYPVNRIPAVLSLSDYGAGAPQMLAFDGGQMIVTTTTSTVLFCTTSGVGVQSAGELNCGANPNTVS